ncbi:MAG: urease accessory protein [Candidatus Azotimanducaceae bacterium]|jgi:urease accessory protein
MGAGTPAYSLPESRHMPPHDIPHDNFLQDSAPSERVGATPRRALRLGIGGPVGSGKTTLVGSLCALLREELSIVVVTNDIFTSEDADALRNAAALPTERIVAVQTGCCPHTAIRDDIAANLDAVEQLEMLHGDVDLTLVESGGDNLTAIFSRGLVDVQIFVLDTAGGDDVPRKGGPGVAMADLLVINKIDLAQYVGSDVDRMLSDARDRRDGRPVIPTSLVDQSGAREVAEWVVAQIAARRR